MGGTEILQFNFSFVEGLLGKLQLLVDEVNGVFRDLVFGLQAAVHVFGHQRIDEFRHLSAVGAYHGDGYHRGLLADAGGCEIHPVHHGQVVRKHERQFASVIALRLVSWAFDNAETVVTRINPVFCWIITADFYFFFARGNELFIGVVVLGKSLRFGLNRNHIAVKHNVVNQTNSLRNLFVEFNLKWGVLI
jgi:hypothetical protein